MIYDFRTKLFRENVQVYIRYDNLGMLGEVDIMMNILFYKSFL